MDKTAVQTSLLKFISENYMIGEDEIPLDSSLIDEGIIDSFGLIEIASFLQGSFGIAINDEDMIRDNFGSVTKMVDFVCRKNEAA